MKDMGKVIGALRGKYARQNRGTEDLSKAQRNEIRGVIEQVIRADTRVHGG
jgi:hypothetical protein